MISTKHIDVFFRGDSNYPLSITISEYDGVFSQTVWFTRDEWRVFKAHYERLMQHEVVSGEVPYTFSVAIGKDRKI